MSDAYEHVRALPFPVIAGALGADLGLFKTRKHGTEYYGPCLIHKPKNNKTSFSYSQDGKFNCFSCAAKGRGAIDLVKLARGIGFQQAVEFLEGIQPPSQAQSAPIAQPVKNEEQPVEIRPLEKDTWRKFQVPCEWLEKRIPDAGIRERYGVFCYNNPARKSAYSGRVMIPVKDINGLLFGYLGRSIHQPQDQNQGNGESPDQVQCPKYLFPKNLPKSSFLFGARELTRPDSPSKGHLPLKVVYLVESPFSVLHFASLGLPAVSPFGWSISEQQTETLATLCRGVVYLPDRNKYEEALQSCGHLARCLWLRVPTLPDTISDPERLSLEQIQALTK